jgi:flagellar hook protein FlgE
LSAGFVAGDTMTVDGVTLTFVAGSTSSGTNIGVGGTVQDLFNAIGTITGVPPTISNGKITLNSGTAADLNVACTSDPAAFAALGFSGTVTAQRGMGTVVANDVSTFDNESISGGAVTGYNSAGSPVNIELRWVKTASAATGGTDTWNLYYQNDPAAGGTQPAWTNVGTNFTFSSGGTLTNPTNGSITIPGVTVAGQSLGNIQMTLGSSQLTQYASTGGTATINGITQNGYAAGQLQSLAINNNGIVVGTFSNGQNIDLAEVTLSHFNGTNYLQALDGGAYAATQQSGAAIAGSTATIVGSEVEGSNADIADQFTQLIVTQQAYSANTKVITTANDMVQDLLNVLR